MVAWDVAEVESAEIAAELVQRACLKERYCRPRGFGSLQSQQQPLILHADNGNAVAAGFREAIARRHARIKARRAGCAALVLQAEGQQRQPLLGITVPHTVTAASNSSRLTNVTAVPPSPSALSAPMSTRKPARPTQTAGANPLAAGANQ